MKSLTLHALDDQLAEKIRKKAKKESLSMNELAKRLLAEALGLKIAPKGKNRSMFADFCGAWSDVEEKEFHSGIVDVEQIDPEDWK